MDETYNKQRLIALRKSTRTIADVLRSQMKEYLSTLAPLFRPRNVLGSYVEGGGYEASRIGEGAFRDLQNLYQTLANSKLYSLPQELKTPLEVISPQLEMTPVEYLHEIYSGESTKSVVITSPFKWVLSYSGFGPSRFREVLHSRDRSTDSLKQFVLHYLMMHSIIHNQPGLCRIMEALHFPLSIGRTEEFGDLPIAYVSSSVATVRPPDDVIIESTEVSGMNVFEEVVDIDDIARLRDPLKEQLLQLSSGVAEAG